MASSPLTPFPVPQWLLDAFPPTRIPGTKPPQPNGEQPTGIPTIINPRSPVQGPRVPADQQDRDANSGADIIGRLLGAIPGLPSGPLNPPSLPAPNANDATSYHRELLLLIGEIIGVAVLAFLADTDRRLGTVIIAFLTVVWLLWLMQNLKTVVAWSNKFGFPVQV